MNRSNISAVLTTWRTIQATPLFQTETHHTQPDGIAELKLNGNIANVLLKLAAASFKFLDTNSQLSSRSLSAMLRYSTRPKAEKTAYIHSSFDCHLYGTGSEL